MRRLSGLDATFLYAETPSMHMHVSSVSVFKPSRKKKKLPFTRERLIELIERRIYKVPSLRERLATVPFGVHHPLWVDDPEFDIEYHIRSAAVVSPGGDRELAAFAAEISSRPLDRSRPLWELYVVDGLADGNAAMISKTHHAAIDGVSGMDIVAALFDLEPEPEAEPPTELPPPDRVPSDVELFARGAWSRAGQPVDVLRVSRRAVRSARNLFDAARVSRDDGSSLPLVQRGARTSINRSIGPHRGVAFCSLPLGEIKRIKNALGGTVNDVVLAICAGALVRYFDAQNETLEDTLVAMVPISVRTESQQGELGNRVSSMNTSLATDITDPVLRLQAISSSTSGAKDQHDAIGADVLTDMTEFAFGSQAALAARLYSRMGLANRHRPPFNVTISNVPGPQLPLYSLGAKMLATYPLGPISEGAALNMTVNSYMGEMFFGFNSCRDVIDDVWFFADAVAEAAAELGAAATDVEKGETS
jgi:WS/DGAT/MGAT family acyltransferase